jgi:hypothetical protein
MATAGTMEDRLRNAESLRISHHADGKGWKGYMESVSASIKSIVRKFSSAAKASKGPQQRGKQDLASFFGRLSKLPAPGAKLVDGKQVSGRKAVKVRTHKKPSSEDSTP